MSAQRAPAALSRIALGTAQFGLAYGVARAGERVSEATAHAIVREAARLGVHTLDTAMAYGNSEEVLGRQPLAGWQVVTKLPPVPADCSDVDTWVRAAVHGALQRLRVPRLHGLLLHQPQQLRGPHGPALLQALRSVQARGQADRIGLSIYHPDELGPLMDLHPFGLVQAPCNLLDQRLVRSGWARRLKLAGVEVHTRSAFLQGLLLAPAVQARRFADWAPLWRAWQAWLAAQGLTALEACLRFVLHQPEVDRVVLGFDDLAQLRAMARAAQGPALQAPGWPPFDERLLNPSLWNTA